MLFIGSEKYIKLNADFIELAVETSFNYPHLNCIIQVFVCWKGKRKCNFTMRRRVVKSKMKITGASITSLINLKEI